MNLMRNRVSAAMVRAVLGNARLMGLLTKLSAPDEEVDVELLGAPLRLNKRNERSFWRMHRKLDGTYAGRHIESLLSLALVLGPGDTFVDVGANVGLFVSVLDRAADLYPSMRFYAIEPNPETARRLRESVRGRDVDVHAVALAEKSEDLEFVEGVSSLTFSPKEGAGEYTIPSRRSVIPARRLDELGIIGDSIVLKISARGYEREVLAGAKGLLETGRIKAMTIHLGDSPEMAGELEGWGFVLFDRRTMKRGHSVDALCVHRKWLSNHDGR